MTTMTSETLKDSTERKRREFCTKMEVTKERKTERNE